MAINIAVDANVDNVRPVEDVHFGDEEPYTFTVPKVGKVTNAMRRYNMSKDKESAELALMDAQVSWMAEGFGSEQWQEIEDRIDNEHDYLDFPHILAAFQQLMEVAMGRPTTSPNASSRQRPARQRRAAPSPTVSESETSTP